VRANLSVFLCFLLLTALGGCGENGKTEPTPPNHRTSQPDMVRISPEAERQLLVEEVRIKPIAGELTLSGKVQYSEDRFGKVSSPVVGRVTEVRAKLGERVAAGQVLVRIESAEIGAAYSDYVKAHSDLNFATRNYELAKELYETKALSKKDLVQAENDFLKFQAEYRRARERLLALRVPESELDKPREQQRISSRFDLKSPIEGTVVDRNVTMGQMVGNDPAQILYTIADLAVLQVVAEVYEKDLRRVSRNAAATVTVEAYPDDIFPATVVYIGDVVDPTTRTIKIRCNVKNSELKLKPEMFARVNLKVGAETAAMVLPKEAIIELGGRAFVYVQTGEGTYVRRPVVPGIVMGDIIQIREGLQAGERVVVKGALLLKGEQEKG
jgi:cobalt-zinc-cadmium efflux system membrane fusion protein